MRKILIVGALLICGLSETAVADEASAEAGAREYANSCAACHGPDGKGGGQPPAARVVDLSQLSGKNGGVFPTARVYATIDGRLAVAAHGPRDMPVWGRIYTVLAGAGQQDPYLTEAAVRARIQALIDHIYLLQEPPAGKRRPAATRPASGR